MADQEEGNVITPDDVKLANEILKKKHIPLSWEEFTGEYMKKTSSQECQKVRETSLRLRNQFCKSQHPAFMCCGDFIAFNKPFHTGLLKVQLILQIHKRWTTSAHLQGLSCQFNPIASDEEKTAVGKFHMKLGETLVELPQIATLATRFKSTTHIKAGEKLLKFHSFFQYEDRNPSQSAIHKITYYLNLCQGKASPVAVYEFSRSLLGFDERGDFGSSKDAVLKSLCAHTESFKVDRYSVSLKKYSSLQLNFSWVKSKSAAKSSTVRDIDDFSSTDSVGAAFNSVDVPSSPGRENLCQSSVSLQRLQAAAQKILSDYGIPLTWDKLYDEYAQRVEEGDELSISREELCENLKKISHRFCSCDDFISLNYPYHIALIKLQLILRICKHRGTFIHVQRLSHLFNIIGRDEEREKLGKNHNSLLNLLNRLPLLFKIQRKLNHLSPVELSTDSITFDSYFVEKGDLSKTVQHKIFYFKNILHSEDVQSKPSKLDLFVNEFFSHEEKKCYRELYSANVPSHSNNSYDWPKESSYSKKGSKVVAPHTLSKKDVSVAIEILSKKGRPLDWIELYEIFHSKTSHRTGWPELRECFYRSSVENLFCLSPDFIAIKSPFHITLLKLQLILQTWYWMRYFMTQVETLRGYFNAIANTNERECVGNTTENFIQLLQSFPELFAVPRKCTDQSKVNSGKKALRFRSFFVREKSDAVLSAAHKVSYYVNLCGGQCEVKQLLTFVKTRLCSEDEKKIGNTKAELLQSLKKFSDMHLSADERDITLKRKGDMHDSGGYEELRDLQEVNLGVAKQVLKFPMSWEVFSKEYKKKVRGCGEVDDVRQVFMESAHASMNLHCTDDFITDTSVDHMLLLKLQFVLQISLQQTANNHQCTLQQLNTMFKEIASSAEKDSIGKGHTGLLNLLMDYPHFFHLPAVSKAHTPVKPGLRILRFSTFFKTKNDTLVSAVHKVTYFVNLSDTGCKLEQVINFVRMELSEEEKMRFGAKFTDILTSLKNCSHLYILPDYDDLQDYTMEANLIELNVKRDHPLMLALSKDTNLCVIVEGTSWKWTVSDVNQKSVVEKPVSNDVHVDEPNPEISNGHLSPSETPATFPGSTTQGSTTVRVVSTAPLLSAIVNQMFEQYEYPIVALTYSKDILVVSMWEGESFVLELIKLTSADAANGEPVFYPLIWSLLQNERVLKVVFDCEAIGHMLFSNYGLQLENIFDIKVAMELITQNQEAISGFDHLCKFMGMEGVPQKDVTVVHHSEAGDEKSRIDERLLKMLVSNAMKIIPDLYTKMLGFLGDASLEQFQQICTSKLNAIYNPQGSASASPEGGSPWHQHGDGMQYKSPDLSYGVVELMPSNTASLNTIMTDDLDLELDSYLESEELDTSQFEVWTSPPKDVTTSMCMDIKGNVVFVLPSDAQGYCQNFTLTREGLHIFNQQTEEDMAKLVNILRPNIRDALAWKIQENPAMFSLQNLTELVLDCGRNGEARFSRDNAEQPMVTVYLTNSPIEAEDLQYIENNDLFTGFSDDNRGGIDGTLHSIRGVKNRKGKLIGLTTRIGRSLPGCADMVFDFALEGKSILLMGPPGVGKTTVLRELARCLNDLLRRRTVIVDTSNEIAGDGDVPHHSIGGARRLQVPYRVEQYKVMIEGVKNHNAQVLIVDEIESFEEASAVYMLGQRGVQLITSIHGDSLPSCLQNPAFAPIFRDVRMENEFPDDPHLGNSGATAPMEISSIFHVLIEMVEFDRWLIHDLPAFANNFLKGKSLKVQERLRLGLKHRRDDLRQQIMIRHLETDVAFQK